MGIIGPLVSGCSCILTTILIVLGLASGSSAWAKNGSRSKHPNAIKVLCSDLLTQPEITRAVDVEGAPGLKILATELSGAKPHYQNLLQSDRRAFYRHELISSAHYARRIFESHGEVVLMVPGVENRDIRGFDGVIFNSNGTPVANYSLKTLLHSQAEHAVKDRADRGVAQAKAFSFMERWLLDFGFLLRDQSGALSLKNMPKDRYTAKLSAWLGKVLTLFGVNASKIAKRPTRVVVDIQNDADLPDVTDIETMRGWVQESGGLIESIIVMKNEVFLEIK